MFKSKEKKDQRKISRLPYFNKISLFTKDKTFENENVVNISLKGFALRGADLCSLSIGEKVRYQLNLLADTRSFRIIGMGEIVWNNYKNEVGVHSLEMSSQSLTLLRRLIELNYKIDDFNIDKDLKGFIRSN